MAIGKVILDGSTLIDATPATATAADITAPKTAMLSNGVMTTGTATTHAIGVNDTTDAAGGTIREFVGVDLGSDTVTAEHLELGYTAHDATGTAITGMLSPGGGGLEYETGTWTPASDVSEATISFSNSHTTLPFCVMLTDDTVALHNANVNLQWSIINWYSITGRAIQNAENSYLYARVQYLIKSSSSATSTGVSIKALSGSSTQTDNMDYWLTTSGFHVDCGLETRLFSTSVTYKWIAVWAPTT